MNFMKKVGLVNILLLLIYSLSTRLYVQLNLPSNYRYGANYESLSVMMMILIPLTIQIIANFVWGLVLIFSKDIEQKEKGKVFLLNSLLLLLIGFPTCLGSGVINS
jgi:hypothetical protein